jgi:hypothetical protein
MAGACDAKGATEVEEADREFYDVEKENGAFAPFQYLPAATPVPLFN